MLVSNQPSYNEESKVMASLFFPSLALFMCLILLQSSFSQLFICGTRFHSITTSKNLYYFCSVGYLVTYTDSTQQDRNAIMNLCDLIKQPLLVLSQSEAKSFDLLFD